MNEEGRKGGFVLKNGGASDRDAEQSAISLTANERQWTRISKKRRMGFFNPQSAIRNPQFMASFDGRQREAYAGEQL